MDSKGEESKISYPNIFFMIDSFEEVGALSWSGSLIRGCDTPSPWPHPPGLTQLQEGGGGRAGLPLSLFP